MNYRVIPGEYECVSRQTINKARLKLAHETPCDKAMAYVLIAFMHDKYLKNVKAPKVRFRAPQAGKQTARAWGGIRNNRGFISLPETPYNPMTHKAPNGYLRVGVVCHEFAHVIEFTKTGKSDHGRNFTLLLDTLLYETEFLWSSMVQKAAESK